MFGVLNYIISDTLFQFSFFPFFPVFVIRGGGDTLPTHKSLPCKPALNL
jgi:hypothetical protein